MNNPRTFINREARAGALLRLLLPESSPHEALEAVYILRHAIDALWDTHGAGMAAIVNLDDLEALGLDDPPSTDEDEIPF